MFQRSRIEGIAPQVVVDYLFAELSQAPPYPDAPEVIAALRRTGMTVAIASNADDAHLYAALDHAGITADVVISSESARSYKPRRPFFEALSRALDLPLEAILHVGDHPLADVTGARNVGMSVYHVQRYQRPPHDHTPAHEPTWQFPDLRGLLTLFGIGSA